MDDLQRAEEAIRRSENDQIEAAQTPQFHLMSPDQIRAYNLSVAFTKPIKLGIGVGLTGLGVGLGTFLAGLGVEAIRDPHQLEWILRAIFGNT